MDFCMRLYNGRSPMCHPIQLGKHEFINDPEIITETERETHLMVAHGIQIVSIVFELHAAVHIASLQFSPRTPIVFDGTVQRFVTSHVRRHIEIVQRECHCRRQLRRLRSFGVLLPEPFEVNYQNVWQ